MKQSNLRRTFLGQEFRILIAILCLTALSASSSALLGQQSPAPAQSAAATTTTTAPAQEPAPKISNDQLDSLVAPIALYPDPLVAQVLAASTYPLEIVQLEQWMKNNKTLKDKALADAVAKQSWDPSVQSLAAFPDVVKQLSEHVSWTMDLGNAFLAQQANVLAAVQRMRAKAQSNGNLKTTAQQKVETQTVASKQVIVIQSTNPDVIYVPTYSATVVYGAPVYPYPYVYPPGYGMLAFGAGVAMGAAWGSNWGNCNWGGGDVTINNNNNFNRNTNINGGNRNQINNRPGQGGGGNWQHNPSHRGGAPYGDRGTANKFGGQARQQPAGGAGNRAGGGAGAGNLGGANRPGGGAGAGNVGGANRPGGAAGASTRPAGGGASAGPANRPSGGGANSIGSRNVSSGGGGGAFGGGGGGSARAASSRGGHSMGGGGFSGGGGSRGGGGGRGGGGRRR